jgi:hypothetical protein
MKTNVIIHIYNEQYLLPFWLEHHSKIFDHGVIIDYRSTDASLEICKKICPTWTIITSRNEYFDSRYIDTEVMDIENQLTGIKICLNVTEFLFLNKPIKDLFKDTNVCFAINSNTPYLNTDANPTNLHDLIQLLSNDNIKYLKNNRPGDTGFRYIHNHSNGGYNIGRHSTGHYTILTEDLQIVWLGYFPWNQHMIKRKMQIKNNMPEYDKQIGAGIQHLYSLETMEEKLKAGYLHGRELKEINIYLYNIFTANYLL